MSPFLLGLSFGVLLGFVGTVFVLGLILVLSDGDHEFDDRFED